MREPAFGRRLNEPHPGAFVRSPSDDGVKLLSHLPRQQQRGRRLVDLTLHFGGGILLLGAVLGKVGQFRDGIWQGCARQRGFHEPLRDEIGKAPVRRGGMRVVFHRQRKVSGSRATGQIERIDATPDEFDDGQGKVGELFRRGGPATRQESLEGDGIRGGGKGFVEFRREGDQARPAFGITQDAAQGGKFFTRQIKRRHGIRGHHEFLDQLRRPVGLI